MSSDQSSKNRLRYAIPLAIVGLADSLSYLIVGPSIIFYILGIGGTQEQYGLVLSSFSFASFLTKPFLGGWTDNHGFRAPYFLSLSIAAIGGLLYLFASICPKGNIAVSMVLLARLLGGIGAGSSALGFAYVARTLPTNEQTKMNSILSMMRIIGMVSGPAINVFLADIDFTIGGFLHVDSLNSVGIALFFMNLVSILGIYFFLEEPPLGHPEKHGKDDKANASNSEDEEDQWVVIKAFLSLDCLTYLLSIFSFNAAFQIIETAFAPATHLALGWGPVQISTVFGFLSIVMFISMMLVFQLSAHNVSDKSLLVYGLIQSAVGYSILYFLWTVDGNVWDFTIPILLTTSSFPFLGAPTRSLFTTIVDSKPALDTHHGMLQAVLSMGASVAGFVAPGLLAAFVLKRPDELEGSVHERVLTAGALFAPVLSLLTLACHLRVQSQLPKQLKTDAAAKNDMSPTEKSPLTDKSENQESIRAAKLHERKFHPRHSISRQSSAMCMGVSQPHHHGEDKEPEPKTKPILV